MKILRLLPLQLILSVPAFGQEDTVAVKQDPLKTYTTKQVEGAAPLIDGLINDAAWGQVSWSSSDRLERPMMRRLTE